MAVDKVKRVRYLGVIIDKNRDRNMHIDYAYNNLIIRQPCYPTKAYYMKNTITVLSFCTEQTIHQDNHNTVD